MPHTESIEPTQHVTEDGVATLNALGTDEFVRLMLETCHLPVSSWAERLEAARPFENLAVMVTTAQSLVHQLDGDEVVQAHANLTRLGERRVTTTDRQARWSRIESAGIPRDQDTLDRLHEANLRYLEKFGHVFLISAAGLQAEEMLEAMERRMHNDREAENEAVRAELAKLVQLRLERLVGEMD